MSYLPMSFLQVTKLSMLKPASAKMLAISLTTPTLLSTSMVMRSLPSERPMISTRALKMSVSVMTPTTAPTSVVTGTPPILFIDIRSAASSIGAFSLTEMTLSLMISRMEIFARSELIS